jgi:hypothetical protein
MNYDEIFFILIAHVNLRLLFPVNINYFFYKAFFPDNNDDGKNKNNKVFKAQTDK